MSRDFRSASVLLIASDVVKPRRIRQRMLYVVLLGTLISTGALVSLVQLLNVWAQQRGERAHDAVLAEVERLSHLPPGSDALGAPPLSGYVGFRGGWLTSPGDAAQLTLLPPVWRELIAETAQAALVAHGKLEHERMLPRDERLLIGAAVTADGHIAWVGNALPQPTWIRRWHVITSLIIAATLLLATTALWSAFSFRRSASALSQTLIALGKDLTAPVPTANIAELQGIADGIRGLAAELLASRGATEQLTRELTQKERLAALGRVAAGVAHEVRNPLASIKLRLDLTLAGAPLSDATRKSIVTASDEIARLDRLVSDLLVVAGKQPGPRSLVPLAQLARARAEALLPWAQQRAVDLRVEEVTMVGASGTELVSVVDEASLSRAFDNLLRNAIEASPSGQPVTLRVAALDDTHVQLSVDDRGRGVDEARIPELFEPFFTTKSDGTGLGLAISRAIARAHGGDLTYARVGDVTRFTLTLMRSDEQAPAARPAAHTGGAVS